jgi:hypothetical protein
LICNEVIDALKGQKSSRHTHSNHIFKFGYREVYAKNNLPDYIVFYNNQKDFFEGLSELCLYLFEKWDMTIQRATTLSKLEWKKWIRSTFSIVLNNRVFSEEIKLYKRKHTKISYFEQMDSKADAGGNFQVDQLQIHAFESECLRGQSQDNWMAHQKNAFFWKPGDLFKGQELTDEKPMTIAYFFRWLRVCSGAKVDEIATEVNVNPATVGRWKMNTSEYFKPLFPEQTKYILSPVYFSKDSIEYLGLYHQDIRSFQQDISNALYQKVKEKKDLLWGVYGFIQQHLIEQLKLTIFDEKDVYNEIFESLLKETETDAYCIKFRLLFSTDIDIQEKIPDALLYVISISKG